MIRDFFLVIVLHTNVQSQADAGLQKVLNAKKLELLVLDEE